MKVKLTISYDGTNYNGWQKQSDKPSVQETIENALSNVLHKNVHLVGSGRTDAGVHAVGQVASFSHDSNVPADKFFRAINMFLPPDIRVLNSQSAPDDFDASRSAKRKTYRYSFYYSNVENPLKERYMTYCYPLPDFDKIKKAMEIFTGEHDFKCFCASGSCAKTTVRTVYKIDLIKTDGEFYFEITGNGFLYNMVRSLVGTLLWVGYNRTSLDNCKDMLISNSKKFVGKTLPAKGLTLMSVEYV